MIKCKICGHDAKERLIDHIIKTHKMSVEEYKEKYGEYTTQEYKDKTSKRCVEKWKNQEYRDKTNKARNESWTDEKKAKQSEILKDYYLKPDSKTWNDGLTKETSASLRITGEKNKKHLTGRRKENYPYLMEASKKLKKIWKETSRMTYPTKCLNEKDLEEWKEKIKETISRKIANGEISSNQSNRYKNGKYENKNGTYFFDSSWEEESMLFFDSMNIKWTNKHGIRIDYIAEDGVKRKYIPDFLIEINNIEYIIEVKGWKTKEVLLKQDAAEKVYGNRYIIVYTVEELKEKINEIIKG